MKKLNHNGCYIKCKIFNRSIVIAALVDSGNVTNESLISENLSNLLNLKVEPGFLQKVHHDKTLKLKTVDQNIFKRVLHKWHGTHVSFRSTCI